MHSCAGLQFWTGATYVLTIGRTLMLCYFCYDYSSERRSPSGTTLLLLNSTFTRIKIDAGLNLLRM